MRDPYTFHSMCDPTDPCSPECARLLQPPLRLTGYEDWQKVQAEVFKDFPPEKLAEAKLALQEEIKQYTWNTELEGDKMNLTDLAHQCYADNKAWFPEKANDLVHHALGLAGESGEVANWAKKIDRGTHSLEDEGVRKEMGEEVVDVLIYALSLCAILGINPEEMWKLKRAKNQQRFGKKENNNAK